MELNLEKYEIIFIVSFQVGILDTSKYSTWKHRGKKRNWIIWIFRSADLHFWTLELSWNCPSKITLGFFQLGIPDFPKYSTWKHRENGEMKGKGKF